MFAEHSSSVNWVKSIRENTKKKKKIKSLKTYKIRKDIVALLIFLTKPKDIIRK